MRFNFAIICITCLLISASTGCQSFRKATSSLQSGSSSLFGLKKRDPHSRVDPDEILDPLGARDSNRLLLDDLSWGQIGTTLRAKTTGRDQDAAIAHYQKAQSLYDAGLKKLDQSPTGEEHKEMFTEAANEFRLASAKAPDSELEEESTFYEGESYFFADRYVQSNRAFEKLVAKYAGTRYIDMAQNRRYAISVYWLQLSETASPISLDSKRPKGSPAGEARRILNQIRMGDPTGKLADDASLALGQAFLQSADYYNAADTFEDLRHNYPGSKHVFQASMLELEARLAGYQGKSYDDTPLRKADALMKTIVQQFPQQSKEQLGYLEEQASKIRSQIAERDYTMGRYFEGRGENRAAKIYYQQVAEQYQDTELGQTIEQQIAEVSQKPAKPEQHAKWLVDLFPNPEKEKPAIIAGNNEGFLRR
jgi:outer membrane protein assembly factor BamD (BamD/ComL family)